MKRQHKRGVLGQAGFTLAELLIVIAIIAIMAGFGFVNVIRYRRDLKLQEMDDIARQVFIAAQNHLTANQAAGRWDYASLSAGAASAASFFGEDVTTSVASYWPGQTATGNYYALQHTTAGANLGADAMDGYILPFGAIDDTVRLNGQYWIVYDAKTGTIGSVVYTDDRRSALSQADVTATVTAFSAEQNSGSSKDTRRSYSSGGHNFLIGCYGFGESAFFSGEGADRPIVAFENEEALVLTMIDSGAANTTTSTSAAKFNIKIEGETSKAVKEVVLDTSAATPTVTAKDGTTESELAANSGYQKKKVSNTSSVILQNLKDADQHRIYIDRITLAGAHFADLFTTSDGFIPGENIIATVSISRQDAATGLYTQSEEVRASANSLFRNITEASSSSEGSSTSGSRAYIANGRHLQNLSQDISGVNPESSAVSVTEAELVKNIYWTLDDTDGEPGAEGIASTAVSTALSGLKASGDIIKIQRLPDFKNRVLAMYNDGSTSTDAVFVYKSDKSEVTEGSFYAIRNTKLTAFEGNKNRLVHFPVQAEATNGNAGIFAEADTLKISNLFVTNSTVTAAENKGSAGVLIGSAGKAEIEGCGAYYESYEVLADDGRVAEMEKPTKSAWTEEKAGTTGGDGKLETRMVSAPAGAAGGLIGEIRAADSSVDGSVVRESFAAVKVSGLNAGGLIGRVNGSIKAEKSYSGGHVKDELLPDGTTHVQVYDPEIFNVTNAATKEQASPATSAYAAGGLIGYVASTGKADLENCYSTSSVGAETPYVWLGGLVGADESADSKYQSNYAAGLVEYTADQYDSTAGVRAGAFAGKLGIAAASCTGNVFLTGINVGLSGVAEGDDSLQVTGASPATDGASLKRTEDTQNTYAYAQKGIAASGTSTAETEAAYPMRAVTATTPAFSYFQSDVGGVDKILREKTGNAYTTHIGDWQEPQDYLPVRVVNGNRLVAYVTVPKGADYVTLQIFGSASSSNLGAAVIPAEEMVLRRDSSEGSTKLKRVTTSAGGSANVENSVDYGSYVAETGGGYTYAIVLDDITAVDGHFAQVCGTGSLIPGENIFVVARTGAIPMAANAKRRIAVKLQDAIAGTHKPTDGKTMIEDEQQKALEEFVTGTKVTDATTAAQRKMAVTNSLFGYSDAVAAAEGVTAKDAEYTLSTAAAVEDGSTAAGALGSVDAKIYSFRHLENLSSSVSNLGSGVAVSAEQTRDLVWTGALTGAIKTEVAAVTSATVEEESALLPYVDFMKKVRNSGFVAVTRFTTNGTGDGETGTAATHTADRYMPVLNAGLISYDGGNHEIANVQIEDAGEGAGIFAAFAPTAGSAGDYAIKDLFIRNPLLVEGTAIPENAGALSGSANGTAISNVLVYADGEKSGYNAVEGNKNYDYGDLRTGDSYTVGVHTGTTAGGLIGTLKSGSVTNCASAIAVQTTGATAGGLIGAMNDGTVSRSYSGGHTVDGKYNKVLNSGKVVYNVTGRTTAGGLVGSVVGGTIIESYSTCSVSGSTVGGFVGSSSGTGTVNSCYSTGLVDGSTKGAFAGSSISGSGNSYVTGVNIIETSGTNTGGTNAETAELFGIAGTTEDSSAVAPMADLTLNDVTQKDKTAYRYDSSAYALTEYPFTTAVTFALKDAAESKGYVHVGDWEDGYEHVLVVNE